jgi:hypothetical protein
MKVGILSMQRVINYGSFLQSYALKETLNSLGHQCFFIDIKPGRQINEDNDQIKKLNLFTASVFGKYFFKRVRRHFFCKNRTKKFNNEFFPVLGIKTDLRYDSNYDAVVIGSDEVFNCTQKSSWGFAKTLFGEGLDSDNIITYAASCGHTTLENIIQYGIKEEIQVAMSNLNAISVRDDNTKRFSKKLTNKEIHEHIDPTLIYNFGDLVPQTVTEKDFILVYAYDDRINDKKTIKKIREFAKKEKKRLLSVGVYQSWCDMQILPSPFELLSYFKNADYVVTDTFHGSVLSIKYNKQFATIIRESNEQKLRYLLKKFNLVNQEVTDVNNLEIILKQKPDYKAVNAIIKIETECAIKYLKENLKRQKNDNH